MALEPLVATASVDNGADIVTVTGAVLTPLNCRPGASVAINGYATFVKALLTTTTFQLSRNWPLASVEDGTAEIAPFTAEMASRVALSQELQNYNANLVLFEAYRRGLYCLFSGETDLSDPEPGHIAFDNVDLSAATAMVVSDVDANGQRQSERIAALKPDDEFTIRTVDTGSFVTVRLTEAAVRTNPEDAFQSISNLEIVETFGDMSADAYLTLELNRAGSKGDAATVEVGGTVTLEPGAPATVVNAGSSSAAELVFGIPQGATGAKGDGLGYDVRVDDNAGLAAHGNHALPWRVLVEDYDASGRAAVVDLVTPDPSTPVWSGPAYVTPGAVAGAVIGPDGAVDERIAVFDGVTGELIKDGGVAIADLATDLSAVAEDIIPATDGTNDLGTLLNNFAEGHIEGLFADTVAPVAGGTARELTRGVMAGWCNFDGVGASIRDSVNISSTTVGGTGLYTWNYTNSFSNTNYAPQASSSGDNPSPTTACGVGAYAIATGSVNARYYDTQGAGYRDANAAILDLLGTLA